MKGLLFLCAAISLQFAAALPRDLTCANGAAFAPVLENCYQFIQCSNGQVHDCSDGLHFDEKIGFCVKSDDVNCNREQPIPDELPELDELEPESTTTEPESEPEVTTTEPESEPEVTTTEPESEPEVTTTEPESEPEVSTTEPESEPEVTTTESESESEVTTTEPESEQEPEPKPTTCPQENSSTYGVYLPHETNCSLFYQCDWGRPVERECPAGLHFNPTYDVCDWPQNSNCVDA